MVALNGKGDFDSSPRFELIGVEGFVEGLFPSREAAAQAARKLWPNLEQNEDDGWDIRIAGVD